MSTNTDFLNLVVPEGTDLPDITALNVNWETIDNTTAAIIGELRDTTAIDTLTQKVDNINNKLGATTDTNGSNSAGTISGKLNKIINEIAAHINRWGADKATKVDNINTAVAVNNTASATGTLSQKLSQLIADVAKIPTTSGGSGTQKVYQSYNQYRVLTANTINTIVNIDGAGRFHCMYSTLLNPTYCSKVTFDVDGEMFEIAVPENGAYMFRPITGSAAPKPVVIKDSLGGVYELPIPVDFKNYLTVQITTKNVTIPTTPVTLTYDILI